MLQETAVVDALDGIVDWWAVAGGWAIDCWLGAQSREHHDIEVVVRRCDQGIIYDALAKDWTLWCLDPPGSEWRIWDGGSIEVPAFQLQGRSPRGDFDLFAEAVDDRMWTFRRDPRIQRPADQVLMTTNTGIPIVRPEVQLLYMAASQEEKNQHDFQIAHPHLRDADASWLADALSVALPAHPWIAALRTQR